jgi:hypothetical protein
VDANELALALEERKPLSEVTGRRQRQFSLGLPTPLKRPLRP